MVGVQLLKVVAMFTQKWTSVKKSGWSGMRKQNSQLVYTVLSISLFA